MKKHEVEIGRTYVVKVSGNLADVKILGELTKGWFGVNERTGRKVHIKTAARLRRLTYQG